MTKNKVGIMEERGLEAKEKIISKPFVFLMVRLGRA
jgi:hypothetical protein